jgi:dGTPase
LPHEEIERLGDTGSKRIDTLVRDLVDRSSEAGDIVQSDDIGGAMDRLRTFMFEHVYLAPAAQREHPRIERMLRALFDYSVDNPPAPVTPGATEAERVTDYIAGMTDRYAVRVFTELSVPHGF